MKRFITVLSGLLVLPAFAEVAPLYYDEIVEYTDDMIDAEDAYIDQVKEQEQAQQNVTQRNTINRNASASRAISASAPAVNQRANTSSRAMASSPRSAAGTARRTTSRAARTSGVTNRPQATVSSRGTSRTTKPVTARVGTRNNPVMSGSRAGVDNTQQALYDSGNSLYNPNTSRVGIGSRRASARISTSLLSSSPATTTNVITQEEVKTTTDNLSAIAELTDYCKAQYAACMDNYCNVLDDNQGRCSCSKNIKNYEKTEAALAKATEDFKDTVQKIKYIGLTGPQIQSLFAETEAELEMKSNSDSSRIKTSLDAIKKSIVDVSSPSASSNVTSAVSLDLNGLLSADFSGGFDLNSFLGANNKNDTSAILNQRGDQLYKSATARCKVAVLNSCTAQGIDANVIANSYDLEIDKQCVLYERSLNDANVEMRDNVANAVNILQQARLLLTQNKNSLDVRGCVAAIDSCMQDDYVCGADYELCLDPTGKYLANGEVVKGGTPGISGGQVKNAANLAFGTGSTLSEWTSGGMYDLYATWNYTESSKNKNAWSNADGENLGGYIDNALADWKSDYEKTNNEVENLAKFLLQKVGYVDKTDKLHGMCAAAMKQCQDYTFNTQKSTKKYIPDNEVVRMYLASTLAKIKSKQDEILSDYAEGCRADVQSCLSSNGYDESNTSSTTSTTAVNSCAAEITTCMSVGGYKPKDGTKLTLRAMKDWVSTLLINCPANTYIVDDGVGDGQVAGSTAGNNKLQCQPCVPVPNVDSSNKTVNTYSSGGQVTRCHCDEGYTDVLETNSSTGIIELIGCRPETTN